MAGEFEFEIKNWVKFELIERFLKYLKKNCLGFPCYLIVLSGGLNASKNF